MRRKGKAVVTLGRATSYDVARLAGVSQSAVSRCFSAGASISPETRARVEAAARQLGYSPNALARSLITRRSRMVGVVLTNLTTRNYPDLAFHLGRELQAHGNQLLLFTLAREHELATVLPQVLDYRVDGLISCVSVTEGQLGICRGRGVPVVLYNRHLAGEGAASIGCDHLSGMNGLVAGLHGAGYRRLALLAGPADAPVSREREAGCLQAIAAAGLAAPPLARADYSYDGGRAAARELLGALPRAEALVAVNDAMALGAIDACRYDLGLRVPEDVGVTGFDDVPEAAWPAYSLTTVRQPVRRMTAAAVRHLQERIETPELPPERRLIGGVLQPRGSTRPFPAAMAPAA